jgi:hypothetical protein
LTPSARFGNLIAGDGTENGLPAPNKELSAKTKNNDLTGKAPYKFESISLQRRVTCEPDFLAEAVGEQGCPEMFIRGSPV